MRLKRLQLYGFKSFADRTTFEFGHNTLTGVVGPNGCGKSNVVDSVRWVLGEQRPTSLRGAEMTDVIFKGSSSRPGLAVADVTLILDNANGVLQDRGAEVAITRRVFKSGEGEYLIDGEKCRLKDVREMLFDTGLGSRGYSVLEQGKIDAVLSANPLERRRIFEEAAGISRYRQRKLETELRLKRVADDMTRLDDLVGELETRVRSLKIQAGKAERFVEARDTWVQARSRSFKHRLWLYEAELAELDRAARALEERSDTARAARESAESDVVLREKERDALAAEVDRLSAEAGRMAGDGRALDERRAQLSARVLAWEASATEEGERARALETQIETRVHELESLAREREALVAFAAGAAQRAELKSSAARELETLAREVRGRLEGDNRRVLTLLQERTSAENRIAALEASRAPAQAREQRVVERLTSVRSGLDLLRGEENELVTRATQAALAQTEHEALRRELARAMAEAGQQAGQAESEKKQLELERARLSSKIDVLLDRERDLEELSAGAKRVLDGVAKRGEPCPSSELVGLVADHLRTDTRHARALDAVLGARANALVAKSRETAQLVLGWLKKSEAGQVGLVLPGGVALPEARGALPQDPERIVGPLQEQVRCEPSFEPLRELLTGDVLIARDLETALALVAEHPAWRFVTREGELVDGAGLYGGHRALTQGAVGRRSSAEELRGDVEQQTLAIERLEARRAELAQRRVSQQKEWERSSHELETRRQARASAEAALATARARLRDHEAGLTSLEQESGAAVSEIARIERELEGALERRESARLQHEAASQELARLEAQRGTLEQEREVRAREEAAAAVEHTRAQAELEAATRRHSDRERALEEQSRECQRSARIAAEALRSSVEGRAELARLEEESLRVLAVRAELDEKLGATRTILEAGRGLIEAARRRAEQVTRELEEASARLSTLRLETQRRELARDEILRRAAEELAADERTLMNGFEPEPELRESAALDALELEVRELKAKLDKLGPVNMEAMSELQESGARLEFLTTQRADLNQARRALEETIATIDVESKRLFVETFETVRANFQRIFRQLFGGGKADVTLEEGVDVLDAGVDIVARPPGRELLSIGLLSGGQRTLTALALLFAVFEARPSPFCILDEVDAALDDVNVGRFLGMLDGFRKSTQFVIVTHNKVTMTACESLYGITMETKGVSRHVSVELDDVERWSDGKSGRSTHDAASARNRPMDEITGLPVVELMPVGARDLGPRSETELSEVEAVPSAS